MTVLSIRHAVVGAASWRRTQAVVALSLLVLGSVFEAASAQTDEREARGLVEGLAGLVYSTAWPTATYTGVRFGTMRPAAEGYDVTVVLDGTSGFGGGPLWMEIVLEFRNRSLHDVRVLRHNAVVPPFTTARAVGELLLHAAERNPGATPGPLERSDFADVAAVNRCDHAVSFALRYEVSSGEWRTGGWWTFQPGSDAWLRSNDVQVRASAAVYFVSVTEDGVPVRTGSTGGFTPYMGRIHGELYIFRSTWLIDSGNGTWLLEMTC